MGKYTIYTLLCEGNNLYVGVTSNLNRRYKQHLIGKGANFTRINKPIRVLSHFSVEADGMDEATIYEDARAIEMILKVGIIRCRGGRFFNSCIKEKSLRRHYSKIPNKYKNIRSIEFRAPKLVSQKTKPKDKWSKLIARSKYELRVSSRMLEG